MAFFLANYRSACCQAGVRVAGDTTQHYVCRSCSKPCDAVPAELTPLDAAVVDILEGESGYRVRTSPIRAQCAREAVQQAAEMTMGLSFSDADPVARCHVGTCQWHGHGDSINDAVLAWTKHLTTVHRNDWPD